MNNTRLLWKESIARALTSMLPAGAEAVTAERITMETPPDPNLGDLGFPLFGFAKILRSAPAKIAEELLPKIQADSTVQGKGEVKAVGPYINVFLPKGETAAQILDTIINGNENYGKTTTLAGKRKVR